MNTPIDLSYFQEKIGLLNRDIDRYAQSSGDLARTLVRLAITANEDAVKKELNIEWQPIETAPKDKIVLVLYKDGHAASISITAALEWVERKEKYGAAINDWEVPTHWIPMTPLPTEAERT